MIRNRKQIADYHVRPIPRMRRLVVDQAWLAQRKHMIRGLIEVDVTTARQTIRVHRAATGERLSFTAFLVACLGHAVDANRDLQAYQDWRGRLIVCDDVDVVTIVEIMADGQSFPLAHIVRAASRRTVREIHDEIRAVQVRPAASRVPNICAPSRPLCACQPGCAIWSTARSASVPESGSSSLARWR